MFLLLSVAFIISRLIFINPGNVFFDSKEYLIRWAEPDFLKAVISGHPPLHSGFVATFWPIYQLASYLGISAETVVLVGQTFLSLLTIIFFYKAVCNLFNNHIAIKAAGIFSALPIFWIVNSGIMMETTYLFYWVMSLYCVTKYILATRNWIKWANLAVVFWVLAFLTHTVVIMWIPLFLYLVWTKKRAGFWRFLLYGLMALLLASLINGYLLSRAFGTNIMGGLYWLYAAKFGEHAQFNFSFETILRYGRNWIVPLGYNNSWVVLAMAIAGLILAIKRNRWLFGLSLFWLIPSFITNQWWDSLLYGRHSLIASLSLTILIASYLNKKAFLLFFGLVTIVSLAAMSLMTQPIPYLKLARAINQLPPGGLVIDSHFARPQTNGEYFGQIIYVDEPGWNTNELQRIIDGYINNNKRVFVTGQALSEPYGLFCGPYLHNLSLSYRSDYILSNLTKNNLITKIVEVDSRNNLDIYEIKTGSSEYPPINNLRNSRRRIDWLDPLRIAFVYLQDN